MADLMDIGNDIQESISRSYDVPEGKPIFSTNYAKSIGRFLILS
jgi:hypothetical protein